MTGTAVGSDDTADEDTAGDDRFLVVHALRVRGLATQDDLADVTGLEPGRLAAILEALVAAEHAKLRSGRVAGYALTKAGRASHAALVGEHVGPDERAGVGASYERFLPLNGHFKDVCTRWQMRPGPDGTDEPNDHADPGYDVPVIDELAAVHDRVVVALADAGAASARFARYPDRFAVALDRVRSGDTAAFARPMSASYHDVWMELHEDFLLTLGRERDGADGH